jgi:hypothetical protein
MLPRIPGEVRAHIDPGKLGAQPQRISSAAPVSERKAPDAGRLAGSNLNQLLRTPYLERVAGAHTNEEIVCIANRPCRATLPAWRKIV